MTGEPKILDICGLQFVVLGSDISHILIPKSAFSKGQNTLFVVR